MEVIRNKYLTTIIGRDIILKLPTNKYDDIVGITNNELLELPEYIMEQPKDDRKVSNEKDDILIFNGKTSKITSLLEFADMCKSLYISSIYSASSKFEKDSVSNLMTQLYINSFIGKLVIRFLSTSKFDKVDVEFERSKLHDIIPDNETDEFIYHVHGFNYAGTILKKSDHTFSIDCAEYLYDRISEPYNNIIKDFVLFDSCNNKYTIPILNEKEVYEIVIKLIINMLIDANNTKLESLSLNIEFNVVYEIFLELKTWKNLRLGMMSLIKNGGQEDLVSITALKCRKELEILKTLGKSFLQTKIFQKKIMNWNQEDNNI